ETGRSSLGDARTGLVRGGGSGRSSEDGPSVARTIETAARAQINRRKREAGANEHNPRNLPSLQESIRAMTVGELFEGQLPDKVEVEVMTDVVIRTCIVRAEVVGEPWELDGVVGSQEVCRREGREATVRDFIECMAEGIVAADLTR